MPIPEGGAPVSPTRRLLTDDVFDRLSDDIVRGRLAPGERVHDVSIAADLGYSRATVRTAILRLTDIGLVEAVPNLYTRVAPLDLRYYLEAEDTARALYLFAVRAATPLLTDERVARLSTWASTLGRRNSVDPEAIFTGAATAGLFQPFVETLENKPLERTLARLRPHLLRVVGQFAHLLPVESTDGHVESALEAACRRNADGAVAAFNAYYDTGMALFHDRLAERPEFAGAGA